MAVGRLVETPAEVTALVDAFATTPTRTLSSGLAASYGFLIDLAQAIKREMIKDGLTTGALVNDYSPSELLQIVRIGFVLAAIRRSECASLSRSLF